MVAVMSMVGDDLTRVRSIIINAYCFVYDTDNDDDMAWLPLMMINN